MKYQAILLIFIVWLLSCKKKESVTTIPPASTTAPTTANFSFWSYDVNGSHIWSNAGAGNTFIIRFYQNNNTIYTIKTDSNWFTINNFKDGAYIYEVTDSLGLFSYTRDSIVSKSGSVYLGRSRNTVGSWTAYPTSSLGLGSVQIKPTFTLLSYTAKDTVNVATDCVYIKVNAGGANIAGGVIFYFYKNNKVSSNNLYNYGPLYNGGFVVSNANPSFSNIFWQTDIANDAPFLHSGDSIYFAAYPSATNPQSFDYLAPKDTSGNYQITAIGTQKLIIPYKWQ